MRRGGRRHVVKVKRGVHADGPRAVKGGHRGLGPRDPRSPCEAMGGLHRAYEEQECMVMKTASVESRKKTMASSSRRPVRGRAKDLKASSLAEAGHASTSVSHALWGVQEGLPVWSSKPGVGGFAGLDLKTRRRRVCRFGPQNRTVSSRRMRGTITKLASRRS